MRVAYSLLLFILKFPNKIKIRQALKGFAGAPAAVMRADAHVPTVLARAPAAGMRTDAGAAVCHAPHW